MNSRLHHAPKVDARKCVQIVGQGIPGRFSNKDAHRLVAIEHDGQYCPKRVFKEYRKAHPEHPVLHRINSQGKVTADGHNLDR
jgi:hypothetical protein